MNNESDTGIEINKMKQNERQHIALMSFNNNSNIGLYAFANDEICLVGQEVDDESMSKIKEILNVPTHKISIAGTSLVGVFCAGNSNILLVPHIIQKSEEDELIRLGINYKKINTKFTALGNIIATNNKGAVLSPEFSDEEVKLISEYLAVPAKKGKISELNNMGSCLKVNNIGGIAHKDINKAEIEFIQNVLQIEILDGTVNMGSPYVSSGIIANSNGFIIGSQSAGPEITNADIALGFLKE